ncbi:putative G-protein coupled receptor B0563.6 [Mytilus galloprovincialis]|uniref:GPR139 n=1 Tax=Mytilus edulis TaxID=6550 RepID=A0A8S3V6C1_MYTED|nr:GPR139 [Mytilus edulis]
MLNATLTSPLDIVTPLYQFISEANDTHHVMGNFTTPSIVSNETVWVPDIALALKVGKICYKYIGPIICAIGILCNIMNLLVLTQRQLKESPYTYLTGLALTDLGALTFSFIFMVGSYQRKEYFWKFYDAYIYLPLVNVCTNSSVWITVVLTIERFLFVRYPLWAKAMCDRASAKMKNALIISIMFVINIPHFLLLRVEPIANTTDQYTRVSTDFRHSEHYYRIRWFYSIIIHFVPLIILSTANAYLVYAVMRARKEREILQIRNNKEATWYREQVRLTVTLISIVCLFIVCIIPSAFSNKRIAYALFGGDQPLSHFAMSNFYLILQYVANVLVWCNLSLNFVFYCAINKKFRYVMRWMVQRWIKNLRRRNGNVLLLVNFKSGHSITRNSSSQTNSITMTSKTNPPDLLLKTDRSNHNGNHKTALIEDCEKETENEA